MGDHWRSLEHELTLKERIFRYLFDRDSEDNRRTCYLLMFEFYLDIAVLGQKCRDGFI
jgi:hypothetical protein